MLDLFLEIEPILKLSLGSSLYGATVILDKFSLSNNDVTSIKNLSFASDVFSIFSESIKELDIFAFFDFDKGFDSSNTYAVFTRSILI